MSFTDRWYQTEAVESVFGYFQQKAGNPVVAMPTGTGKSVVIARLAQIIMTNWPRQRILCLTHVKELVAQNAAKLEQVWPGAPYGIYSAGLKSRDTAMPVIFAGVASVYGRVHEFGWRDLVFIDEAHLVNPDENTMYQKILAELRALNPMLKVVGFTATAYRTGQGMITNGGLFTDICYDITGMAAFNRLIAEGYMAPLFAKPTNTVIDTSGLRLAQNGDFKVSELESALNKVVVSACQELIAHGHDRQSWLVFAPGIENAEKIAMLLNSYDISSIAIHSKLKTKDRDNAIADWKSFKIRCAVTNNMLTTGVDHPGLDLIGMMRPTMSVNLWVQMAGRGTRVSLATGKTDCRVMDFARNTVNLGPINDPYIPKKRGESDGGDAPVRICPTCGTYNAASARFCMCCNMAFDFSPKIVGQASTAALIRSEQPIIETLPVAMVAYGSHTKKGGVRPCMKVTYVTGVQRFNEYIHIEAPYASPAGKVARDWWRARHTNEPPATVVEALAYQSSLRVPKFIRVIVNRPYPEVVGYEYE